MCNATNYDRLCTQLSALTADIPYQISNLSNAAALLYQELPDINWAGFYIVEDGALILGPFQGKPACIRIEKGRGVCGTAWETDQAQLVADVHAFPGHIACDCASRSEIVLPIHYKNEIWGVLDIDSPTQGRFTEYDLAGLTKFVQILETALF